MSTIHTSFIVPEFVGAVTCAPLRFSTSQVPSSANDVVTKSYVDSLVPAQINIIYISSVGSPVPDGRTLATAFSSLPAAITAATSLVNQHLAEEPPRCVPVVVYCADAASFTLTENITIPSGVFLHAPHSIIKAESTITITLGHSYCGIDILHSSNIHYEFLGVVGGILGPWELLPTVKTYLNAESVAFCKLKVLEGQERVLAVCDIKYFKEYNDEDDNPINDMVSILGSTALIQLKTDTFYGGVLIDEIGSTLQLNSVNISSFSGSVVTRGGLIINSFNPMHMGGVTIGPTAGCIINAPLDSTPTEVGTGLCRYAFPYSKSFDGIMMTLVSDGTTEVPMQMYFTRREYHVVAQIPGQIFTASNTYLQGDIPNPAFYVDGHAFASFIMTGGGAGGVARIDLDRATRKITIRNNAGDGSFPEGEMMLNAVTVTGDLSIS